MSQIVMTPSEPQAKIVLPKRPRRISPDCAEVLHILASFDANPNAIKSQSEKG
ncbi:hypothetical protein [Aestuariivirga sp.]|uniref:hypothetical protein n=1 Tax=Aestuariivirga sp. TaxID=2650926 RepID=UPI0039E2C6C6